MTTAQEKWKSSGLTDAHARKLKFEELTAEQVQKRGSHFLRARALHIPYWTPAGKQTDFYRLRYLEAPAGSFAAQSKKPPRYAQPASVVNEVYLPPLLSGKTWTGVLSDAGEALVITEGELKAASACAHGLVCLALGGVDMWRASKRGISVLPVLANAAWEKRKVIICFDSDSTRKFAIQRSISGLGRYLQGQGAEVVVAALPDQRAKEKTGLDDYLVAKGIKALRQVLDDAKPFWPVEKCDDLGNAGRFARAAAGQCVYAHEWETWLWWDGTRWQKDAHARVFELAADVAVSIAEEATRALRQGDQKEHDKLSKFASYSRSHKGLKAMVATAATTRPDLKVVVEQLDADQWLLNVENGTIDLRTGELRPHDCDDLITKVAPVRYDPRARSPLWAKTLSEILPDKDLREFLQRWLGHSLTGDVREEKLAFLLGEGRNGKGTIVETVLAALGEYACAASEHLLLAHKFGSTRHPTELADLYGKRLVVANEIEEGQRWNVARVKGLTGGDRVKARRMHEDFWEFNPTHKITVLANKRPRASADDPALWARLKVVPFEQSFAAKPNTALKHELRKSALPAVLAWLVEGCLAWQRDGLGEPAKVREATAEYRAEQRELDPITPFLADARGRIDGKVLLKEYAARYNEYVEQVGRRGRLLTEQELAAKLRDRGYRVEPGAKNKTYVYPPKGEAPKAGGKVLRLPKTGSEQRF